MKKSPLARQKYKDGGKTAPKEKTVENTTFPVGYDPKTGIHRPALSENNSQLTPEQWQAINLAQGNTPDPSQGGGNAALKNKYAPFLAKGWTKVQNADGTWSTTPPEGVKPGDYSTLDYKYQAPIVQPKVIPQQNSGRTFLANDASGNTTFTNTDPNNPKYKVGETYTLDKAGNPVGITQTFNEGGKVVKKAPKIGYQKGGHVMKGVDASENLIQTGNITPLSDVIRKGYVNGGEISANEKMVRNTSNKAGTALGGYGAGYYANSQQETDSDKTRAGLMGAIAGTGPIGGAISGIAGIGDQIGAPVKNRAEATDEQGNLVDPTKAKQMGLVGGLLSPSKALAYRADSGNWTDISGKGYTDYLEANAKKKIADEKALRDKEKFQGALDIAMNERGFKDGGIIKGAGTGKSDSINAKIKPNSFVVPIENVELGKAVVKSITKSPIAKAKLKQGGGTPVKVSNGELLIEPSVSNKINPEVKKILAPNAENGAGLKDGGMPKKKAPKASPDYTPMKKQPLPTDNGTDLTTDELAGDISMKGGALDNELKVTKPKKSDFAAEKEPSFWDKINSGGALEYAAAAGQIGLGLKNLKNSKRPTYTIDKSFNDSMASAQSNLDKAKANAQFGFTPQEQFAMEQANKNALNDQLYAARNLSGGSAGNAYNQSRMAINDSYGRSIKNVIAGNDYRMQKQNYANSLQQYNDQLVGKKLDLNRQIFDDSMNMFLQKQNAGQQLLGAGIQNAIGANRYQKELDAQEKANNVAQGWNNF